jgi:hypothetical protein
VDAGTAPKLSISTDAHVVSPLFFPGGDIGKLAVCGTVNDVAMLGRKPLYLTAGFILEEGLPMDTLKRVVESMRLAAEEAGVQIVAGDTKVVQRGKADGMYITTAGVGVVREGCQRQRGECAAGRCGDSLWHDWRPWNCRPRSARGTWIPVQFAERCCAVESSHRGDAGCVPEASMCCVTRRAAAWRRP